MNINQSSLPADLPRLLMLDCSSCTPLSSLPSGLTPLEEHVYRISYNRFNGQFGMPQGGSGFYDDAAVRIDSKRWRIEFKEFEQSPKGLLKQLGEHYLLKGKPLPAIDYLDNGQRSDAIDGGGVRRDFITRLSEKLFSEGGERGNTLTTIAGVSAIVEGREEEERILYSSLGAFLALCYHEGSTYKTGSLFDTLVYDCLARLHNPETVNDEWLLTSYLKLIGAPASVEQLIGDSAEKTPLDDAALYSASLLAVGADEADEIADKRTFFSDPSNRQLLRDNILAAARDDVRIKALVLIAQQMQQRLGPEMWQRLCQEDGAALQAKIEGELSADKLLTALDWSQSSPLVSDRDCANTRAYLEKWVRDTKEETLATFVHAITGNRSLGPYKLFIQLFNRGLDYIPKAHTCSFSLELSAQYPNQEVFNDKLHWLLTEGMAGRGFQEA